MYRALFAQLFFIKEKGCLYGKIHTIQAAFHILQKQKE